MWLPDWLYRILPIIYTISGLASIVYSRYWLGYVSGALLLVAGALVWKFRADYKDFKTVQLETQNKS
jgi:hypothetical protein